MVEQLTLNQRVASSNLARLTIKFKGFQGLTPESPFSLVSENREKWRKIPPFCNQNALNFFEGESTGNSPLSLDAFMLQADRA